MNDPTRENKPFFRRRRRRDRDFAPHHDQKPQTGAETQAETGADRRPRLVAENSHESPREQIADHRGREGRPRAQASRRRHEQKHLANPELSIVIPLVNEAESLRELHQRLSAALADLKLNTEIIFVDDGSDDNSFKILTDLQRRDRRVRVIQFRRNYGKSAALAAGFARAAGRFIVTMDADLQDDPAEIKNLLQELHKGFDLISGWKRHRHDPFIKRITSKIFNRVTGLLSGLRLHDINCGLKAYRREVTQVIPVYGELHRFLPVLAYTEGFRVGELVVKHHPRKFGRTKFGPSRFTKGFFDLLTVLFLARYTKRPLHLFGLAGGLAFLAGLGVAIYLTIERVLYQQYLTNRPILFLGLVLMIIGVQMVSIGLLGEMITAANPQTPSYFIKTELGFGRK